MLFPVGDWQFWVVTACAAVAAWWLVRPFFGRGAPPSGPCASCPKSVSRAAERGEGRPRLHTIRSQHSR